MATELEIMRHARGYLEQLAAGVNPLTGETLPETDVACNDRIARCLTYVAGVLGQVIECGGVGVPRRSKPFALTPEQLARFEVTDVPMYVSFLTQKLNALIEDPGMKRLSNRAIGAYLEHEGLLGRETDAQGKPVRTVTEKGSAAGLSAEARSGYQGPYVAILYHADAQRYVLEHIGEVVAYQESLRESRKGTAEAESGETGPEDGKD